MNVCDGFRRLTPATPRDANGVMEVELALHATAHCFQRRHSIRVQVSSGAHPRYARNTGTGEPIGQTTTLVAADVEIFHDHKHKALITLPVYDL
jgi:predicted acyl esterase